MAQAVASTVSDLEILLLILQVIIAAATVVATVFVSIWVAKRYGERAAANYEFERDARRNHALRLSAESKRLMDAVPYRDYAIQCWFELGKLRPFSPPKLNKLPYETRMFLNHLETGQKELWESITKYVEKYEKLASDMLGVYELAVPTIASTGAETPGRWLMEPGLIVQQIAAQVQSVLVSGRQAPWFSLNGSTGNVKFANSDVYMTTVDTDAPTVVLGLNTAIESSISRLKAFWTESVSLVASRKEIEDKLHEIEVLAQDSVPLEGWCEAGVKARFEGPDRK